MKTSYSKANTVSELAKYVSRMKAQLCAPCSTKELITGSIYDKSVVICVWVEIGVVGYNGPFISVRFKV